MYAHNSLFFFFHFPSDIIMDDPNTSASGAGAAAAAPKQTTNKGRKYEMQERNYWFHLCRMFDDNKSKYGNKQAAFLDHKDSGNSIENSNKFRMKLSRWYRKYKKGELRGDEERGMKRHRAGEYEDVAALLIQHLNVVKAATGVGLSWEKMRCKAKEIGALLGKGDEFKASSGWLNTILRKAKKIATTAAQQKLPPITPIQAFHHLGELKRFCKEQACHMDAISCCEKLDQLLRVHNAGQQYLQARQEQPQQSELPNDNVQPETSV